MPTPAQFQSSAYVLYVLTERVGVVMRSKSKMAAGKLLMEADQALAFVHSLEVPPEIETNKQQSIMGMLECITLIRQDLRDQTGEEKINGAIRYNARIIIDALSSLSTRIYAWIDGGN